MNVALLSYIYAAPQLPLLVKVVLGVYGGVLSTAIWSALSRFVAERCLVRSDDLMIRFDLII